MYTYLNWLFSILGHCTEAMSSFSSFVGMLPMPFVTSIRASPIVLDVAPEHFDHLYLPISTKYIDNVIITHDSHLDGGIEDKKLSIQILVMSLNHSNIVCVIYSSCSFGLNVYQMYLVNLLFTHFASYLV